MHESQTRRRWVAVVLGALVANAVSLEAAGSVLKGTVTDMTGAPVPGASVEVKDQAAGLIRRMAAGAKGEFEFDGLPAGAFDIVIRAVGFNNVGLRGARVPEGGFAEVVVPMKSGSSQESVSLEALTYTIAMTPLDARWATLDRACQAGRTDSCLDLADLHLGARRNRLALAADQRACDHGDGLGCLALDNRYLPYGLGSTAIVEYQARAHSLLDIACASGDALRCGALAVQTKDQAAAAILWTKACDGGSAEGCLGLAGATNDPARAAALTKRATKLAEEGCAQDHARDCLTAATQLLTNASTLTEQQRAEKLLRKACKLGVQEACAGQ